VCLNEDVSDDKSLVKIDSIIKLLDPAVQNKLYDDLLHETSVNCGKALGTVSEFVLTPIYLLKLCNESSRKRFERSMKRLQAKLSEGDAKEHFVTPASEVAQPILDELLLIDDEGLSEMFLELLAKASDSRTARQVHRGFVTTLREMVPDEAALVSHMVSNHFFPFVRFMFNKFNPVTERLTGLEYEAHLVHPDCISLYLENLTRIGVLQCNDDRIFNTTNKWELLVQKYRDRASFHEYDEKNPFTPKVQDSRIDSVFWSRGHYIYTEYGKLFRSACCDRLKADKSNR